MNERTNSQIALDFGRALVRTLVFGGVPVLVASTSYGDTGMLAFIMWLVVVLSLCLFILFTGDLIAKSKRLVDSFLGIGGEQQHDD